MRACELREVNEKKIDRGPPETKLIRYPPFIKMHAPWQATLKRVIGHFVQFYSQSFDAKSRNRFVPLSIRFVMTYAR